MCNFLKKLFRETLLFFVETKMVRLRYCPILLDLKKELTELLRHVWNYNAHCDKHDYVDCIVYEEWYIEFARTKWQPDFVDFDFAISKIRATDRTFIDFDEFGVFETEKLLSALRR